VAPLLESEAPRFIHAANLCEVLHILWRSDGQEVAEEIVGGFLSLGIQERPDMDGALWRDAAALIAQRRIAGASLPLGDALGVALARRLGGAFVTADRAEIEPLERAGIVNVLFIR
jgi:predicted nucleic acid-binding protein